MEDEDDVQSDELLAGHSEGQPDEDGMEDDAEFKDEDSSHLSCVRLREDATLCPVLVEVRIVPMVARVT